MLHPQVNHPAPFSTGQHPRNCRICGAAFVGLGTLCPTHLAAQARERAQQLKAEREHSAQVIAAREKQAQAAQPKRSEFVEELDAPRTLNVFDYVDAGATASYTLRFYPNATEAQVRAMYPDSYHVPSIEACRFEVNHVWTLGAMAKVMR